MRAALRRLPSRLRERSTLAALALVAVALAFRLAVVDSWHAPAGDGLQYWTLSQSLLRDHRLAFAPPPAPPQFSRLPGYPLFLAAVTHEAPLPLGPHLRRATVANVFLDLGSALLIFGIVRRRRLGLGTAWAAFVSVLVCPILVYLSCYGLSESLATFLTTLTLYCALGDDWRWALAGGAALGLLQLVRIDGVAIAPACALALYFGASTWQERLRRGALFAVAAAVVFAPWPLRNLQLYGEPHVEGTAWMRQDGKPLPLGMMRWMRSWGTGTWGEDYNLMAVANDMPLDVRRPGIVLPVMYDDERERAEVVAVFERYNRERFSPAVDAEFSRLADARRAKSLLRYYLVLPAKRLVAEWRAMPEWELPMRTRLLGLPAARGRYAVFEKLLFALALVGAALLVRRDGRLVLVAAAAVGVRSLLHAFAHPFPVERYLVESFPALMLLTGVGAVGLVELARRLPARKRA